MPSVSVRPRSGVELIDASFQFLRENFVLLFTTVIAVFAPLAVVSYVSATRPEDAPLKLLLRVTDWVLSSAAHAATVVIVAKRYLGEEVTPADALRAVGRRMGTVLAITLLYGIGIAVGVILLIVPGIIVAATWFAAMPVAMVEGAGQHRAFMRSAALSEGSKLRIVAIFGVSYLVYLALAIAIGAVAGAFLGDAFGTLIGVLAMACIYPFIAVLGTLLYFDLRIRREGFDLDLLMELPAGPPATPAVG